jgi:hypothetical protein
MNSVPTIAHYDRNNKKFRNINLVQENHKSCKHTKIARPQDLKFLQEQKSASYCPARDIILMVVAKASGDMMFFVVVLLEEALFSIDNVGGRSRWSSHDGRGGQRRWPSCSEQRQSNAPKGWDKSGAARKDTRDLGFGL